jgi:ethanolamine ammonia-lyase small subunit
MTARVASPPLRTAAHARGCRRFGTQRVDASRRTVACRTQCRSRLSDGRFLAAADCTLREVADTTALPRDTGRGNVPLWSSRGHSSDGARVEAARAGPRQRTRALLRSRQQQQPSSQQLNSCAPAGWLHAVPCQQAAGEAARQRQAAAARLPKSSDLNSAASEIDKQTQPKNVTS